MRILFVVFHFPPISGGGVIVITELANKLAEMGHLLTVLTPDLIWKGPRFNPPINDKISVVRVHTPSNENMKIAARRCYSPMKNKAIQLVSKEKYDFILTIFHPFHLAPKAAVDCGKKTGLPVIVKIDDAVFEKASGFKIIQRKIEKSINTKTLKNASRILVMNEETKCLVNRYYGVPDEKISIIPNGVNVNHFYSKNEYSKKVIFSGVMYYHRGLDVLLEAAPEITKQVPDVEFVLLGDGPELSKLKNIVNEKNLSKNVKFEGWIDREKIQDHLSSAAIGIGPLRATEVTKNALPIKVLEYMASSLPIIAWENTLPADVLIEGKNGFFINSPSKLAEKIIQILTDQKLRAQMGIESRNLVGKFDWEEISSMIIDEYAKCKPSALLE